MVDIPPYVHSYPKSVSETSLFVASYDSQGSGGGIRPRLHTGVINSAQCKFYLHSVLINRPQVFHNALLSFEAFPTVITPTVVFQIVTACSTVHGYWCFGGTFWWYKYHVPPKRRHPTTMLRDVTTRKRIYVEKAEGRHLERLALLLSVSLAPNSRRQCKPRSYTLKAAMLHIHPFPVVLFSFVYYVCIELLTF
jgi:hypothetical protein